MVELWERQPRERDSPYYYKQIYIKEIKTDRTLQKVIDFIKTLPKDNNDDQKYDYNGHLIKLPSLTKLQNLSKRYEWNQALADYTNHLDKLDSQRHQQEYEEKADDIDNAITSAIDINKKNRQELKESDYSLSTRIHLNYELSKDLDLLIKNFRLNHGRSTSISESTNEHKVEAEVYGGFENLLKVLDDSRKQYTKNKKQ